MRYIVVPYSECAAEVRAFRNANRPVQRDDAYFRWRYEARPCAVPAQIAWAYDDAGQPVGAASLIPRQFHVVDRTMPVGLVGDISVLPQARGRGVAETMLRTLRESTAALALGGTIVLPNAQVTGPLTRAGWIAGRGMPRFARVIDFRGPLRRKFGVAGWLVGCVANLNLHSFAPADLAGGLRGVVRVGVRFDARYDDLWWRADKAGFILALRDRANLVWRFADHPGQSFGSFELVDGDILRAYAIYRCQGDAVIVDDFLGDGAVSVAALAGHFVHAVRSQAMGSDIQVRCGTDGYGARGWQAQGFARRKDEQAVMVSGAALSATASWHLTAADKDV